MQQPRLLATHLADFARRLRVLVRENLTGSAPVKLDILYSQARVEIRPDLSTDDFADLLAQVLIYCCLLIRCYKRDAAIPFSQALSDFRALPGLPPFARELLATLWHTAETGQDALADCVRELAAFLAETNIQAILEALRPTSPHDDALIYFYELFLAAYAPGQRSQRGVYYTPAPAIAYMVRAIDALLRSRFAYPGGLLAALLDKREGVFLCDPACGTGAFLWAALEYTRQAYRVAERTGDWRRDLPERILSRLAGCELMPAPGLLARVELATRLAALHLPPGEQADWTVAPTQDASAYISLANALDRTHALELLSRAQMPVILGNPPYAGHSSNRNAWIGHLLESYKDGADGLGRPGQTKWLSDDYVKFLRLAHWQVERAGRGIVAFLTSHSYLDNPTFRGMRLSLLRDFDEIYILDLHGNSKKRELAPGGVRDCNIFGIQQGVAIGIFVKFNKDRQTRQEAGRLATVYHADLWGLKETYARDKRGGMRLVGGKLGWLAEHDLSSTPWQRCQPSAPFYLFTPQNERYQAEYAAGWSLPAMFALNGEPAPGLVTCQDEFAISWDAEEAARKIEALLATENETEARGLFRLCAQSQWNYAAARAELSRGDWRAQAGPVLYRPFDTRWTVFERHVAVHLRERVTSHMRAGPNLALAVGRAGQVIDGGAWDIAFCSRLPTEFNLYRRGGNYLFPLYLYPTAHGPRVANLAPSLIAQICQRLALTWLPEGRGDLLTTLGPEDLFAYVYALLYSPAYRARYSAFLKIDFPRLPITASIDLFRALCSLGQNLSRLHLLEQHLPLNTIWMGSGNNLVECTRYQADGHDSGRIELNAQRYLVNVPRAAWELTIGGYQVAKKWLADRRGRHLAEQELALYQQIIAALVRTRELMAEIDSAIERHGGWPL